MNGIAMNVTKRNGEQEPYSPLKIRKSVQSALNASKASCDEDKLQKLLDGVSIYDGINIHVGPDNRGEQHQDAGELRYGQDAIRTASNHRIEGATGNKIAQHTEPARYL